MKRFLCSFLAFMFVLGVFFSTPVIASAEGEKIPDADPWVYINTTTEENNLTCKIAKYTGGDENVVIVSYVSEYKVTEIADGAFAECNTIKEFSVAEDNEYFSDIGGVLFNKDGTKLIAYPAAKEATEYVIPEGVVEIAKNAFEGSGVYLYSGKNDGNNITGSEDLKIHYEYTEESGFQHTSGKYVAEGATLKDLCSVCEKEQGTAILSCENAVYNENGYDKAKITGTGSLLEPIPESIKIVYSNGETTIGAPKDIGSYTAYISVDATEIKTTPVNFEITSLEISNAEVGSFEPMTYTGQLQTPNATVTINGLDVTGSWSSVTDVTDKTTFTANGNFTGTIADKETGMKPATLTNVIIEGLEETYTYTGNIINPEFTVRADGIELEKDRDYTVSYGEECTDVGIYTIEIEFINNYSYDKIRKEFEIVEASEEHTHLWTYKVDESQPDTINVTCNDVDCEYNEPGVTISLIINSNEILIYDGCEKMNPVNIAYSEVTRNELGDILDILEICYTYNGEPCPVKNAGTYTATVTIGEGVAAVTATKTFDITPKTIRATLELNDYPYNGCEYKPEVVFVDAIENESPQYTVKYTRDGTETTDFTNNGKIIVTVTLSEDGNYVFGVDDEGKQVYENELTYTITKKPVSTVKIGDIADQTYTGSAITPTVTVTINDDETPLAETEYTVTYGENVNAGTGTLTVELGGNYSYTGDAEQLTKAFTINPKTIAAIYQIGKDGIVYNGDETPQPAIIFTEVDDSSTTIGNVVYEVKYYREETETPDLTSAGTITAKITLASGGNYTFKTNDDGSQDYEETLEYTILPKPITVVSNQLSGSYNGQSHSINIKFTDVIGTFTPGTDFSVEYYRGDQVTTDFTNVGEIKAVVTLSNKNYTFVDENGTNTATSTLIYTIKEHVHNWTYSASGAVITATCQNDGCEIESTTVTLKAPENLAYNGTAKSVTVDAPHAELLEKYTIEYTGNCTDAGTYTAYLTIGEQTAKLAFSITKAVIAVTKVSAIDRVYNGTLEVDINKNATVEYSGLVSGDKVGFDLSALKGTLADANVGSNKSVKIDGSIVLTGEDAKNYDVATPVATTVNITPATLTITPDAKTSEQYYKLPELTYKVTGLIGTDTLTKAPALTTNADIKTVGNYTITAKDALATANYTITYAPATLTVTEHKNHIVANDGWKETTEGTCMVVGKEAGTCTLCSGTVTRDSEIAPNNHKLITTVTKKETCTQDGEALVTCANGCKYSLKTALPADGKSHTFATEFTVIDSTCVATGSKYKPCQNPGCSAKSEYAEIAINPSAHIKTELINAKESTCVAEGYTGDKYCPDCKIVVEPGMEIPAKGHTPSDWIVDKAASFTEEGARHTECTVCKAVISKETIAKLTLDTPVVTISNAATGIKVSWTQDEDAAGYTVYSATYNTKTKKWSGWKVRGTAAATKSAWIDTNVENGGIYRYTVRAVNGKFRSAYKATAGLTFVATPTVSCSNTSTGVLINWNKIPTADSYTVYRREVTNGQWGSWQVLTTTKAEKTSLVDTSVKSGVSYRYTVRAVDDETRSAYKTSGTVIFLNQPILKISNSANGIVGSWETIAGATGYKLYRAEYNASTKKWSKWVVLGTAKETAKSFTDKTVKTGVIYKYTIRAVNGKFMSSFQSTKSLMFLAQPSLSVSISANGIVGKWNIVEGAKGYIIQRAELVNGQWSSWTNLGTAKATAKSFTDKTVKAGVVYKYSITAINGSNQSNAAVTDQIVYLLTPDVKISNAPTGVKVTWNQIAGANKYYVYRREIADGKWTSWKVIATTTATSYVDETSVSNVNYRYTVRAANGSSKSLYKSTGTLLYLASPKVTAVAEDDGMKVTWTQTEGATNYTIYRAELGADGKWSGWTVLGTASSKHLSCKDKTAKSNVTYRYTVRAINGKVKSNYVVSNNISK